MNDEIKEILDKWKCYIGLTKKFTNNDMELLRVEDIEKVLDYITNLQQENQRFEENNQNMQEEMARVWEENERLKEQLFKSVNNTNNSMELTEDYKSRCEKAIEYIKANCSYDEDTNMCCDDLFCGDVDDLLNILQNGSDSQ